MTRLITLITFLLFLSSFAYSQKLKRRTEINGSTKDVFYIDKKTKLRNGDYFKLNTNTKDTLVTGSFDNAFRVGKWNYKAKNNQTILSYNFSSDSILFINQEMFADSFFVKLNNDYEYTKVDRPLIFLGYKDELKHIIVTSTKIPLNVMQRGLSGTSLIQFFIDKNGELSGSKIINSFNTEIEKNVNQIVHSNASQFLPAIVNGETVPSSFFLKLSVSKSPTPPLHVNNYPHIVDISFRYGSVTRTHIIRTETRRVSHTSGMERY